MSKHYFERLLLLLKEPTHMRAFDSLELQCLIDIDCHLQALRRPFGRVC